MKLRLLEAAEDESRQAAHWYEKREPGLGHAFLDEVNEALAKIEQQPNSYPVLEIEKTRREVRHFVLRRFPFYVVYEIRPDEVLVVAIAHGSRRPDYWLRRQA